MPPSGAPPALPDSPPDLSGSLEGLLEETTVASPKSVDLQRTPTSAYLFRFMTAVPHIAELYHANSQISSSDTANSFMDAEALNSARTWFAETAYKPAEGFDLAAALKSRVVADVDTIGRDAGPAFLRAIDPDLVETAYPLDLMALHGPYLYRLVPGGDTAWLEREFTLLELAELRSALPELFAPGEAGPGVLLFVLVAPWRYMLLQGPRGYRRTLVDAGRLLEAVAAAARETETFVRFSLDFFDAKVDRLLQLDGVERATLAVVAFDGEERS